ncbi:hypothetical protein LRAMOSA01014 [Lichtheimia ramosa]|uniref:Uncharacterized protein n=1 Tax=Lichtheimia ramosa TaxID=688394 RepID=A0A077W8C3_9FUNG|nr:hypothetical protein LRAMOSA01014 [Lichtheimia ramosa]
MSDTNWCTYCDQAINSFSNSLYCSEECLRADALNHHPLLGYDWHEFKDFPRSTPSSSASSVVSSSSSVSSSPSSSLSSPALSPIALMPKGPRLSPPALELEPAIAKPTSTSLLSSTNKKSIFFI